MRSTRRHDKARVVLGSVALLLAISCASNPDGPGVVNHAPEITGISIGGGKLGIGAGMPISVTAETIDSDGDELSYEWSGDGLFSGGGGTVTWHVPDQYGNLSISCKVSDQKAEDSFTQSVQVGRRLIPLEYGDPTDGQLRWDGADGAPFYILQGEVEIPDSLELIIPGGTTIFCDLNSKLTLRGGGRFEGLSFDDQAVLFTPWEAYVTSSNYWQGIASNSPGKTLLARGLYVRNAGHGLSLMLGSTQALEMHDSKMMTCDKGVEAAQIAVSCEGLSFWECGRGFQGTALQELTLNHCSFFECDEFGIYLGGTRGVVTRCQFSGQNPAAFIGGGSRLSVTGNAFTIPDPDVFLSIGGGYEADSDSLDFRCNYWGEGIAGAADILPRINREDGAPGLLLDPVSETAFGNCGGIAEPLVLGLTVDPEGHPLEGAPGYEDFDFGVPHSGFPAMKLKLAMDNPDQVALSYHWSSPGDAYFYIEGGIAGDFEGGYMDPEAVSYPAREERNDFCTLYAATNETDSLALRVDVQFVLDGEIRNLEWEGGLALEF